jgi:hypothetical protein
MLSFFSQLWDTITGVLALVVQLVRSLFQALVFIPQFVSSLTESVGYLPGILTVFATLSITLVVVNYVIGR